MRLLALFLLATVATAGDELDAAVRNAERRAVKRLAHWGQQAEAAGLPASAAGAYRRILHFDVDHRQAREKLGYARSLGRWARSAAAEREVARRKDGDAKLAKQYAKTLALLEEEHIKDLVRICVRFGTQKDRRKILLPLLDRMPERQDIHKALGHKRIGKSWVRPELAATVKSMPDCLAAWRRFANVDAAMAPGLPTTEIPGVPKLRYLQTEEQLVGASADPKPAALAVARTHAFMRHMLGPTAPCWERSPVLFLDPTAYTAMVKALHPKPEAFALMHRYSNYEHARFYAIRLHRPEDAGERYAHAAAHYTMLDCVVAPEKRARQPHAWLLEGFAYLVCFELFGTDNLSFVSINESNRKVVFTRPPPSPRTRAASLKWVRDQMLAGHAYALSDVFARSINNLDICASLQAYTFLRFLFLHDPRAAARLPVLLAKEQTGPRPVRVERALRRATGKTLAQIEPLWRAFVLEIDAGWGY